MEAELVAQKKEYERNESFLKTKINRISLKSNGKFIKSSILIYLFVIIVSKNRSKAIGVCMRTLLDRHKARITSRCFSRWFEHSKLIQIHSLYKEDMLANQEEFVYVTW